MTPTAIAAIAIPSAAALIWMGWEFIHAPQIEEDAAVPDAERADRRVGETPVEKYLKI